MVPEDEKYEIIDFERIMKDGDKTGNRKTCLVHTFNKINQVTESSNSSIFH